jgi:hypothetical protein
MTAGHSPSPYATTSDSLRDDPLAAYSKPNGDVNSRKSTATMSQFPGTKAARNSYASSMSTSMESIISSSKSLADIVISAAESSQKLNAASSNIAQLRVSNMNLHGRDDEIKLLRGKLREMIKKGKEVDNNRIADDDVGSPSSANKNAKNLILVSGKAGTGKSSLINKGLENPPPK